ncbi:MAG: glycosyltransferase family 88 protein [Legionella sp.]|uniref:glycosyltransferase family 88 protein n=1 Tax=Legionella sp. TaxID=459 RepID=UPI0039E62017
MNNKNNAVYKNQKRYASNTTGNSSAPKYNYNPHRHTKIWLSNNPNLFLNLENQIRLIKMREQNPDDIIHLIYDSSLLAVKAVDELNIFCAENNIIPLDADLFTPQLLSTKQCQLYEFYKDEIRHLKEGGNLAVASDILRWLYPVYKNGTYADFDFPITTSALPETIEVESPLLLNIGSLKLGKKEFILSNNDFVAIVDHEAAKDMIERVQQGLLNRLTKYDTDFVQKTEKKLQDNFFNRNLLKLMRNRSETFYISKSKDIHKPSITSRALRKYVREIMSDKSKFLEFSRKNTEETHADIIQRLREDLKKQCTLVKRLFFSKEYTEIKETLRQDNEFFLHYLMNKELNLYIKSIIVCTTGPIQISNALFKDYVVDIPTFAAKIQPLSFNHYHLQKSFRSQNSIPMHESILGMMRFLGANEGEVNDSSWLESGQILQEQRVKKLEQIRNELALSLPHSLLKLKLDITLQINKLSKVSMFKKSKNAQKEALERILACFHNELFDIKEFETVLMSLDFVLTGVFPNQTKKLIYSLKKLCGNAVIFRLAQNRKIKLPAHTNNNAFPHTLAYVH